MLIQLIYIGLKKTNDGYFDVWATFTDNNGQPLVEKTLYDFEIKHRLTEASPGQLFQFSYKNDGNSITIISKTAHYLGVWQNSDDVAKWQSAHRAVDAVYTRELMCEKDKEIRFDFERLRPFRETFLSLDIEVREMFMAQLICFITRPKKKKS